MTSCLVPDFPAVMVALEHIKELDKQLKEDGAPFSPEASLHLTEITTAISELEADRRATHEHLEVETIENSKLRHQLNTTRERMSQEMMADVAAARAANADEIKQLHRDLNSVSQVQGSTMKRQEALLSQNGALQPEREQVKAEHEEIIGSLNDQITRKYGLQNKLDQTQEQTEELKSSIAAVKQEKITLQQNMVLEREAFSVKKDSLSEEENQAGEKIKQQKQTVSGCREELEKVNDQKLENNTLLGNLTINLAKLESSIRRLTESRCRCEKQLEGESQKHQELKSQKETLRKKLSDLKEEFRVAIQCLQEQIATVEDKREEGRTSILLHQDSLAQIYEIFNRQQEKEDEVRAEYFHVSQQLEQSKLQLEERIASIVKHSKEINEMDKLIGELLEADTINKRMFEINQEEICGNVDTKRKNISYYEEEKMRLTTLLKESKKMQEEHVHNTESDISTTWRRYKELQHEQAALHQRQPKSRDADLLRSYMDQCVVEHQQKETTCHLELKQCNTETESIMRSNKEKQTEVEEKVEMLKEVEAKWDEEHSRHLRLKALTSDLRRKKSHLELTIEGLKEKTSCLLQPREEMKAELEELRVSHMNLLDTQASDLRAVEIDLYDNRVKLEQVSIENSRLHLRISEMTESVGRARGDEDRYWEEVQQLKQQRAAWCKSLQEAWREDLSVTQDFQSRDGVLLMSLTATLDHLKRRKQQLGSISTLLHQQMLGFSKRLGDKATVKQQS
ncbi:coiled-coil domain-containing protein 175 [Notolabrus celidotus]|uniref:coiled-coil domain-containing protein 175 n=1 Tax=Notolabrus celidotus TaxID=1203425 RepID=UPI00148FE870|nr:coiled-coil domain-containing protein 175 [Notolabrus celidotus]